MKGILIRSGKKDSMPGTRVMQTKNDIIIPAAINIPVVFTGVTSLTTSERKPIEVVTHVRKQGTQMCLTVFSILSRLSPESLNFQIKSVQYVHCSSQ